MKHPLFVIFIPATLLLACISSKSSDNNENDTKAVVDDIVATEVQPVEIEKAEYLDSIYILEKEPDMSIEIDSMNYDPDFAFVSNDSLFFGKKEDLLIEYLPIPGNVLGFTWSPDGKFIYFGIKTELNEITAKVIKDKNIEILDPYDVNIYKFDFQEPSKAEYITTLYDRTDYYSEQPYFLDWGNPYFDMTCSGDSLIVGCTPDNDGGFFSKYVVSIKEREVSLHYNRSFACDTTDYSLPIFKKFRIINKDDNIAVYYRNNKESNEREIHYIKEWKTLFEGNYDFKESLEYTEDIEDYFEFSISPNLNKLVFSAFTTGDMDNRTGKTYLSDLHDLTINEISGKVVLSGWFGKHEWLSNDNLLIHDTRYNEFYLIETKIVRVEVIENVVSFQKAPLK